MIKRNVSLGLGLLLALACSPSSKQGASKVTKTSLGTSLRGSVKSVTGSQSEMNQWILVTIERDSGIAHSGVVNALGNYVIEGVDTDAAQTLILLDPQYRLSAILTYSGLKAGFVRQYYRINGDRLPTLVHNGPVINFTDFSSVDWETNEARDSNGNLIPDVLEVPLSLLADTDSDTDGLLNSKDGDIDGDGLVNWIDSDDDGDATPDAFDADANGDGVVDLTQDAGDQYFPQFINFLAVQLVQDVEADGSLSSTLMLTTQMQSGEKAQAVRVKGSAALFLGASAVKLDVNTGATTLIPWNKSLSDDGNSEDGEASDGIFARRIKLAAGIVPKSNQLVLIELEQGLDEARTVHEFPFMFPGVVTGVISGTYAAAQNKVTLVGTPFGTVTNFRWSIHIYDSNGIKVFASEPIEGKTTTYALPSGATDPGQTYTARIVATAIDRIPSFPSWVIRSASFSL